jgi:hypothetical protein
MLVLTIIYSCTVPYLVCRPHRKTFSYASTFPRVPGPRVPLRITVKKEMENVKQTAIEGNAYGGPEAARLEARMQVVAKVADRKEQMEEAYDQLKVMSATATPDPRKLYTDWEAWGWTALDPS